MSSQIHTMANVCSVLAVVALSTAAVSSTQDAPPCDLVREMRDGIPAPLCKELSDYAEWHSATIAKAKPVPAIIAHGRGGFADRMRGIVSVLLIAMATHQLVFVENLLPGGAQLLATRHINTTVPAGYNRLPNRQCLDKHHGCHDTIQLLLNRTDNSALPVMWNQQPDGVPLPFSRLCGSGRCSGLVFHYMFTYHGDKQARHLSDLTRTNSSERVGAGSLATVKSIAQSLSRASKGPFDAMLLRASNTTVQFNGSPLKLTTFNDGYNKPHVFQHVLDTIQTCEKRTHGRRTFIASDSSILKAIMQQNAGRQYFGCCWHPGHVQRDQKWDAVAQLIIDIEIAADAQAIYYVQGGFYKLPLHWRSYEPSTARVYRISEHTSSDILCGHENI